jgi:hypothetical protein
MVKPVYPPTTSLRGGMIIVNHDYEFRSVMIRILLLPECNYLENDLQLFSSSFNDLIAYLIISCIENTSIVN